MFTPVNNFDWMWKYSAKSKRRLDQLTAPVSETMLCANGTELGLRTWGGSMRSGYCGEYADPMWRHLSAEGVRENVDQGWWAYADGPPPDVQPRGNGLCNVGFANSHVTSSTAEEMSSA